MADYQKIAGDILFGNAKLDNAMRGNFIEAVLYDELQNSNTCDEPSKEWHYVGLGWGPWDLQRGRADSASRVRFQIKIKARDQLWESPKKVRGEYVLGFRQMTQLPKYFSRDFPAGKFGDCELSGYRCDFMLLGWHGPSQINGTESEWSPTPQSDPNNYVFFIVPVSKLGLAPDKSAKTLTIGQLYTDYGPPHSFSDLPPAMNAACDQHLCALTNPRTELTT